MWRAPFPYRTVSVLRPPLLLTRPALEDGQVPSWAQRHFGFTRNVVAVSVMTLHASLPPQVFSCNDNNRKSTTKQTNKQKYTMGKNQQHHNTMAKLVRADSTTFIYHVIFSSEPIAGTSINQGSDIDHYTTYRFAEEEDKQWSMIRGKVHQNALRRSSPGLCWHNRSNRNTKWKRNIRAKIKSYR